MASRLIPFKVSSFGLSDVGLVRKNNEDVWAELQDPQYFYVLADGMGGHQAGEIASRKTVDALCDLVGKQLNGSVPVTLAEAFQIIHDAICSVNETVFKMAESQSALRGMGTTLCCLHVHPDGVIFAHVGDSRIYRYRSGAMVQLTQDHSLLRELIDLGQMNEHQAMDFLYKNIITKAIGTERHVEPSIHIADLVKDDRYLICSDGLSDLLSIKEMEIVLRKHSVSLDAVNKLVELAKEKGGLDNITAVLVNIQEVSENETDLS